ncbi:serine carboxypeptidase [Hirsutella rhossiliensis]|uniref:Carboxypeptidase n=1 Tax=Hirsutella rhossiliensis TaxID=111463 RepID=A0A9P8MTA2_9HYPO|nr:serine carboxypeptidase domain-containing protein [Hirsutella rhossiliensis]KAH0960840.1 serine carboxypeptidase domain-containing protein [Hirsutella rhossiliensis]
MRLSVSALIPVIIAASSAVALHDGTATAFTSGPNPKSIVRRPDQFWDHVVKGELANYSLRAKKANPAELGVDSVKQFSGYLDDQEQDKHLFYWFFESRNDPAKDPVVLWLNGGPGCSSMVGLFTELGPSTIPNSDLKPVRNPYAWNNNASVIFLDQPVNTGFSYSSRDVSTTAAASKDVYALLTLFFHEFPQYAKQDFHIAGESYAGHYIPIFSQDILAHKDRNINLKSAMIGNGLTDPLTQYRYYKPMACGEGGYPSVLSESECKSLDNALPRCQSLIKSCYDTDDTNTCASATRNCNAGLLNPYQRSGHDVYDVRKKSGEGTPDYSYQFLNEAHVKEALGVEVDEFGQCSGQVNGDFVSAGDWMKPTFRAVPKLLEQIPVLIYAGDADYICNWLGNRAWTNALEWPGRDAFGKAKQIKLRSPAGKEDYGYLKTAQNFAFLQVREAGHMVPASQPEASVDFFNRWISGEWFTKK